MIKSVIAIVLVWLFIPSTPASAHVLITDSGKSQGAILHIIPDDDPIAGQESTFYFDTQEGLLAAEKSSATLVVTDSNGTASTVATTIDGSLITAKYTFPAQGVYDLTFTVTTNSASYIFEQSQRVSRGATASALDTPSHVWAEMLVIVTTASFLATLTVALRRRKAIAKQSVL